METVQTYEPWNKGKLVGQKPPLKPKDIWAIRLHLLNGRQVRDLAMFNLAIDSKLRGCDLVKLCVRDIVHDNQILAWAMVVQRKTQRPVQCELTEPTRSAVSTWIEKLHLKSEQYLFPSRIGVVCVLSPMPWVKWQGSGQSGLLLDSYVLMMKGARFGSVIRPGIGLSSRQVR